MGLFRKTPDQRRRRALRDAAPGPVRDLLAVEFPDHRTALADARLLAIDLETTGLDPAADRLLSIGFVPVDGVTITLAGARHFVVRGADVGDSATIHGITDDALAAGVPRREALTATLEGLQGRVLLAHHARIEVDFLRAACLEEFGAAPEFEVADTLWLGQEYLERSIEAIPRGHLRLHSLRERFGLPRYQAHDALVDALACAELYLALTQELGVSRLQQVLDH